MKHTICALFCCVTASFLPPPVDCLTVLPEHIRLRDDIPKSPSLFVSEEKQPSEKWKAENGKKIKRQVHKDGANITEAELWTKERDGDDFYDFDRELEAQRFFAFMLSPQRVEKIRKLFRPDDNTPPPLVHTMEGILKGKRVKKYGLNYYSFEGVPYATLPERFQPPKPLMPWTGIKDATKEIGPCPQIHINYGFYYGTEDCLRLNLHTPSINGTELPVIVVVHGGGFNLLSGTRDYYGPERFIAEGVIFISINYRLGPLGYLCTETTEAPGNVGMKDMIAALTWIQRNIHKFGGNASKVTVFGSSSGATAVEYLTLSKMSKGLFSQFILQSGSVLNYLFFNKDPIKYAVRLGGYLNHHTTDVKKLVAFLKNVSAQELIEASQRLGEEVFPLGISRPFSLSVENPLLGHEMFLHDHPENILRSGDFVNLPSMIGFNTMEGSEFVKGLMKDPEFLNTIDSTFKYLLPTDLVNAMDGPQYTDALIKKVRQFYFNGTRISNATATGFVNMLGDHLLLRGLFKSINFRIQKSEGPIYFWQLAYEGSLGVFRKFLSIGVKGVPHADETGYLFRVSFLDGYPTSNQTEEVSQRVVKMTTNFIKYGNPTPSPTTLLPVTWTPLKANNHLDYMEITEKMEMKQDPYPYMDRMAFWKDLYENKNNLV